MVLQNHQDYLKSLQAPNKLLQPVRFHFTSAPARGVGRVAEIPRTQRGNYRAIIRMF